MDYTNEKWAPIIGYDGAFIGRYEVSDHGRIRSLCEKRPYPDGIMAEKITPAGYRYVSLCTPKGYGPRTLSVGIAKQVALAFVPNPDDFPEVDHIDHSKDNNHYTNLRWINHDYNCRRSQGYLYKYYHKDTPEEFKMFQSRRQLEWYITKALNKSCKVNLQYYMKYMLGRPNKRGYVIEAIRLKGSERYALKKRQQDGNRNLETDTQL